jgi:FkbM family methyltransferase
MFLNLKKIVWWLSYKTPNFKGKGKLVGLFTRPNKSREVKIKREGVNWNIYAQDLMEFNMAIRKGYQPEILKILSSEIKKKKLKIMWDIGANIGTISLPILKKFPELRIILFEPSAEVMGKLIKNLSINPDLLGRYEIFNIALSDQNGLNKFYTSNEEFNSGTAGLGHSHNRFKFHVKVQSYTGDDLILNNEVAIPEIIKIDVEGFEFEILQGLKNTLTKYKPIIIFEHCIYRINERKHSKDKILNFLKSFNYKFYNIENNLEISNNDLSNDGDFIARHS